MNGKDEKASGETEKKAERKTSTSTGSGDRSLSASDADLASSMPPSEPSPVRRPSQPRLVSSTPPDGHRKSSKPPAPDHPWGDLEKETWRATLALVEHVDGLWRTHLSGVAQKMRGARLGITGREHTLYDNYFSGKEVVDYLLQQGESKDRAKQAELAQALLTEGYIVHIYFCSVFRDAPNFIVLIRTPFLVSVTRRLRESLRFKERKYNHRRYAQCFLADDAVAWMAVEIYRKLGDDEARETAAFTLKEMMAEGLLLHPASKLGVVRGEWYKFRDLVDVEVNDKIAFLARRVLSEFAGPEYIRDYKVRLKTFRSCFDVQEFVQWLVPHSSCSSLEVAQEVADRMCDMRFIEHVRDDFSIAQAPTPYFRFNESRILSCFPVTTEGFLSSLESNKARPPDSSPYAEMPPPRPKSQASKAVLSNSAP